MLTATTKSIVFQRSYSKYRPQNLELKLPLSISAMVILGLLFIVTASLSVSAAYYYDVDLSSSDYDKDANRKTAAIYQIVVFNNGEYDNTYQLSYHNPKTTWSASFTNYIDDKPEIWVGAGKSIAVNFTVKPTCGCEEGNSVVIEVSAKSIHDSSAIDKISVITTYIIPEDNGGTVTKDSDGDGYSDDREMEAGTDPDDPNDYPDKDTDKDGLPDKSEETLGTDPNNPDSDGDGENDWVEYNQGTDPLNPDSHSETISSADGNSPDENEGSEKQNIFGMDIDSTLFKIVIPILLIVIIISIIVLVYVWNSRQPDGPEREKIKDESLDSGRVEMEDVKTKGNLNDTKKSVGTKSSSKIETIDVKLERSGDDFKCPECGRNFKQKTIKKHLLRTHHKRLKRL